MSVRPILFSGPMVRALLDGRKTQTRRVPLKLLGFGAITEFGASDQPGYDWQFRDKEMRWHDLKQAHMERVLPYAAGDLLWVKEDWKARAAYDDFKPSEMSGDEAIQFIADGAAVNDFGRADSPWGRRRWSQHMCRWASRLTLRVTEVRVQRLQAISEEDAKTEGTQEPSLRDLGGDLAQAAWSERQMFQRLWDSLNAKRGFGWDVNPWVVAVSFEVIAKNVDDVFRAEAAG